VLSLSKGAEALLPASIAPALVVSLDEAPSMEHAWQRSLGCGCTANAKGDGIKQNFCSHRAVHSSRRLLVARCSSADGNGWEGLPGTLRPSAACACALGALDAHHRPWHSPQSQRSETLCHTRHWGRWACTVDPLLRGWRRVHWLPWGSTLHAGRHRWTQRASSGAVPGSPRRIWRFVGEGGEFEARTVLRWQPSRQALANISHTHQVGAEARAYNVLIDLFVKRHK